MADSQARLATALADRYRLERELGAGGMATVYLAQDLKHDRQVALKVLRPELAAVLGAERFVVEIKTTASLQHPHILPLFDSGAADGFLFYVMPFIDGETLRGKLDRETQLGVDEAVRIAREVADALEYAHQHGIVHRDIKPENILLHGGHAMVADFGIALAVSAAAGGRMTETGLSLGTPHYMSPEQATGAREITARSDVYSLGSVLYEMLAGEPPHTGGSAQQIIMKIISERVQPVSEIRKSVPPNLAAAVAKALEKLPADRFASAQAFAEALADPAFTAGATTSAEGRSKDRYTRVVLVLGTVAIGAVALAAWGWLRPARPEVGGTLRFEINLPPDVPAREILGNRVALAPDGRSLVYLGITDGMRRLFLRPLDQVDARPLPGTEGASVPFYSPDSKWVGFVAEGQMRKVAVGAGNAVTIAQIPGVVEGATWGDRGIIAFTSFTDRSLWQLALDGGTPQLVMRPDTTKGHLYLAHPAFLPGGEAVLVDAAFNGGGTELLAVSLRTGATVSVPLHGYEARYAGGDTILVLRDGLVAAVRLNLATFQLASRPVPLDVRPNSTLSGGEYACARNGTLIFLPPASFQTTLVLVDRQGAAKPLATTQWYNTPRFSPDGSKVAVSIEQANGPSIWVYGLNQTTPASKLTLAGRAQFPVWTPDGRMIAYYHEHGDTSGIFWTRSDGAGTPRPLWITKQFLFPQSWTPDAGTLLALEQTLHLWVGRTDGASQPRLLQGGLDQQLEAALSPDGHWLAFTSNESGQWEVYVQAFPGPGGRVQVSLGGGLMPAWSRSGRELFYRSGNRLYVATVVVESGFRVNDRHLLFDSPQLRGYDISRDYDVSPDGQHFVMLRRDDPLEKLQVVLHWDQERHPAK